MGCSRIGRLPREVRDKLPATAQSIFIAAFNSAAADGMSDDVAYEVAWMTVRDHYVEGRDGRWCQAEAEAPYL